MQSAHRWPGSCASRRGAVARLKGHLRGGGAAAASASRRRPTWPLRSEYCLGSWGRGSTTGRRVGCGTVQSAGPGWRLRNASSWTAQGAHSAVPSRQVTMHFCVRARAVWRGARYQAVVIRFVTPRLRAAQRGVGIAGPPALVAAVLCPAAPRFLGTPRALHAAQRGDGMAHGGRPAGPCHAGSLATGSGRPGSTGVRGQPRVTGIWQGHAHAGLCSPCAEAGALLGVGRA